MTAETMRVCVAQDRETVSNWVEHSRCRFRYALARSPETRRAGDSSQDYLGLEYDASRLAFALCDGVSQSFFGGVAARVLGEALLDWLSQTPSAHIPARLAGHLVGLVEPARSQVEQVRLPGDMSPFVTEVLERKRALGSESMFAAGLLDFAEQRVTLLWLGDSRLRVWRSGLEHSLGPRAEAERWSTSRGPVGEPHVLPVPLREVSRIVTYSDGCAMLDTTSLWTEFDSIARAGSTASGDDATILEIMLDQSPWHTNS